jgi:hypothetical protein
MADKPAAMAGVYVDMKFMPGLKMARISIEIPIEHSNEFIRMFGTPDRVSPVAVGIARLNAALVPETSEEPPATDNFTGRAVGRKKLSNIAAILCEENEDFQVWLADQYPAIWDNHYINGHMLSPQAATATLKEALGIKSRTELDEHGPKADAFEKMRTSFTYRHHQGRL